MSWAFVLASVSVAAPAFAVDMLASGSGAAAAARTWLGAGGLLEERSSLTPRSGWPLTRAANADLAWGEGVATARSSIGVETGEAGISMSGRAFAGVEGGAESGGAEASAGAEVAFVVQRRSAWRLAWTRADIRGGRCEFSISSGDNPLYESEGMNGSGELEPGSYRIAFRVWAMAPRIPSESWIALDAEWRLNPLVVCACDFDGDGLVNDMDLLVFLEAYERMTCGLVCPADMNGDGCVDDGDFVVFAAAYDALLCPN